MREQLLDALREVAADLDAIVPMRRAKDTLSSMVESGGFEQLANATETRLFELILQKFPGDYGNASLHDIVTEATMQEMVNTAIADSAALFRTTLTSV
jgi:hypothetical protein